MDDMKKRNETLEIFKKKRFVRTVKAKLLIIGAVVSVVMLTLVSAFVIQNPSQKAIVLGEPMRADTVTIYQNGFTFVTFTETITTEEGENTILLYLPSGLLFETLRINGLDVIDIRCSATSEEHLFEEGDSIIVHTQDETYAGTFIEWTYHGLAVYYDNKTLIINTDEIKSIELVKPVPQQKPGELLVKINTISTYGEKNVTISYLMKGPSWRATHFLDLDNGNIECWAQVENPQAWKNVTLTTVVGGPHVVYRGEFRPYYTGVTYEVNAMGYSSDTAWTSAEVEEYHEYTLSEKISFNKGETVRMPLFSGVIPIYQEYFWSGGKVENRYYLNNTLPEPLPNGIIECYRGSKWVGEDNLEYTPKGDESSIIVSYAYDVKVESKTISEEHTYSKDTYTKQITIENFKNVSITIKIEQSLHYKANLL
ncbi:MAG: hypothetical protein L6265_03220, partial [Thermoplasmatales archaeon]|nr:hypothetical protein [Thermoplasmatales archaeon]